MTVDQAIDQREAEAFLYREARYCDDHRYDDWLALWTDDARYWIPSNREDVDPSREISIVYDDRGRLAERVFRLTNPGAHAQDPRSRLSRVVSNVEVEPATDGGARVSSRFVLVETRRGTTTTYGGRTEHLLRRQGDEIKMSFKKVVLTNLDEAIGNLTFLL